MWKHKIAFSGNERNVTSFVKALIDLGYKPSWAYCQSTGRPILTTNVNVTNKLHSNWDLATVDPRYKACIDKAEYSFNIDNKWEYEAALAICSVRNDEKKPYIGEAVVSTSKYWRKPGEIDIIIKLDPDSRNFNTREYNGTSTWELDLDFCRKATAEEIINYFKNKYNMSTKQIGWIVPENLFEGLVRKGTIYPLVGKGLNGAKPSNESSDTLWLPREIIEKWEPAYEKQEKSVIIGSRNVKVFVEGERVYTKDERIDTTIEELEELLDSLDEMELEISGFAVTIKADERCIRIGCVEENNLFSLNELNSVWELCK